MKKEFGDEAQTYIYRGFTLEHFEEVRDFLIRKNSQQARRNSSQVEIFSEPNPQKIYKLLWDMKD